MAYGYSYSAKPTPGTACEEHGYHGGLRFDLWYAGGPIRLEVLGVRPDDIIQLRGPTGRTCSARIAVDGSIRNVGTLLPLDLELLAP